MSFRRDNDETVSLSLQKRFEQIRSDFLNKLSSGEPVHIEDHLAQLDEPAGRPVLLGILLAIEIRHRMANGESADQDQYAERFPDLKSVVREVFQGAHVTPSYVARVKSERGFDDQDRVIAYAMA